MKTPYADILIDFQKALDAYGDQCGALVMWLNNATKESKKGLPASAKEDLVKAREKWHKAKMVALQKFNEVLTDLQELREGKVTRVGKPRSKRCHFCGNLEDKDKAHLMVGDGTKKWVCDGCWDERLRD